MVAGVRQLPPFEQDVRSRQVDRRIKYAPSKRRQAPATASIVSHLAISLFVWLIVDLRIGLVMVCSWRILDGRNLRKKSARGRN